MLFIECDTFESNHTSMIELCIFFSKLHSITNLQLFCVTERDIEQGPSKHTSPFYVVSYIKIW